MSFLDKIKVDKYKEKKPLSGYERVPTKRG